jgi:CRP-like cAMP-binding protein
MPGSRQAAPPIENLLLAGLPRAAYRRLIPSLELVPLALGEVIDRRGEPSRFVYFPTTAVISMMCVMANGRVAETGMVGLEGTTGTGTCLGAGAALSHTVVQVAGEALRIKERTLRTEVDRSRALHGLMLRYVAALLVQISQSVGCNTHHPIEARLSRWLLVVRDRVSSDALLLRHEFLSQMLGTRRSGVTIAAGSLRAAGLIRYTRGRIEIIDRAGLEASACECYAIVRAAFEDSNGH